MRLTSMVFVLASIFYSALCWAQSSAVIHPTRLQDVRNAKKVRVCIWPDYYGITYRNPKTQQLTGIDVDMAQALAKDLGVKLEFVDSSFSKLVEDVTQNRCDVAMFAIGITPQRQAKLRFTQPYLASDIYAITSKANRRIKTWADIDQAGSVVAIVKGTLHEPIMRDRLKNAKLMVLDTPFAREQEVQSGRSDVFMTDYPYSQRFLTNADWARLVTPDSVYHITPYAYAMAPGDDVWHTRLEKFVTDVKRDGRLQTAAKRHQLEPILVR
ncbi:MAG: amino acid ABC transporter substrate-binding protein [Rhodoferax sp.]|nr:amino acid ABC transporter substrate-binding protein [Rhodoferax sp.]NCP55062.1 amino acid ABC transporter substrate-binding protein [Rhodoferax sp.]PIW07833.1 MAG: amino acid ABC transporter substrate-binding protein [Comamonadaceae bacterium CG17_big_fil_post_rev_8_21_14_2_50_60_13]PIY25555.1 MAG: amino acid ABC transporter substrate-binding protein [Comamonadaceae bacterium CG_4_10_14_3_um_filter_60_75]PJC15892.1 MAG: amino acid ABC transporter substrate-binding protein [Comamonadaceae ba